MLACRSTSEIHRLCVIVFVFLCAGGAAESSWRELLWRAVEDRVFSKRSGRDRALSAVAVLRVGPAASGLREATRLESAPGSRILSVRGGAGDRMGRHMAVCELAVRAWWSSDGVAVVS